jgi:hypothetical protein
LGISEHLSAWFDSPIFKPYLIWEETSQTFLELRRNGKEFPSLTQVARAIIDREVLASNLDSGQQALALELLSDLPDWIDSDNPDDQSISLKNIDPRLLSVFEACEKQALNEPHATCRCITIDLVVLDGYPLDGERCSGKCWFDFVVCGWLLAGICIRFLATVG